MQQTIARYYELPLFYDHLYSLRPKEEIINKYGYFIANILVDCYIAVELDLIDAWEYIYNLLEPIECDSDDLNWTNDIDEVVYVYQAFTTYFDLYLPDITNIDLYGGFWLEVVDKPKTTSCMLKLHQYL